MSDSDDGVDDSTLRLLHLLAMLGGQRTTLSTGSSGGSNDDSSSSEGSSTRKPQTFLEDSYVMVAAIDFGTTFSGYAFSFKTKKDDISMNKNWGAEIGFSSYKTPTCLLLDSRRNLKSFGYAAQKEYSEMVDGEAEKHYYFERFKMKLHDPKGLSKSTTIADASGKTIPALDVFAKSLEYLKDHLISAVSATMAGQAAPDLVRWVITVPAIWGDASKQFMREAATKCRLIDTVDSNKLLIALEPEAASLHVRNLEINQFTGSCAPGKGELNIQAGTKYLVIDAGGGTLDVTAHELLRNGKVKELHYATGGPFGGTRVDAEFTKLMEAIFGKSFIDAFQKKCATQWLTIMFEFEKKKRALKAGEENSTNMQLPWSFGSEYSQMTGKSVESAFKNYKGDGVKFTNGMMCFSYTVMKELFRPALKGIINHIQGLMDMDKLHGVEYFFCVGGFSESGILQDAIYDNFGNAVRILVPEEASLAVVKGAVHFGHEPESISTRMSARTYGVETMTEFVPILHSREKAVPVDGKMYCKDLFRTFVKKGEEVKSGHSKTIQFSPIRAEQQAADVEIYSADRPDVKYITDETVHHHGQIHVNWPGSGKDRTLEITMTFGGTEVHVSAVSSPGDSSADTKINFLSQ